MSFADAVGFALIIIFFIGALYLVKESIMRPVRYVASKGEGVDNIVVKALAAKEAYDMFRAATAKAKPKAERTEIVKNR